ncbi:SOS response-associated peptidase [Adhaeribacter sp. BT258]|uniref:Abasic site processing protein n=1 Tax=Adhaeribacter terrigena TaxID=2793070 RepID=A0ABS1C100_9BACT|nr:SOS response-associated peptidase [Adhaeribacter terrigena]MBK0403076.1 SOS response-associated peptidase [Adhaeribacter terrigena]
MNFNLSKYMCGRVTLTKESVPVNHRFAKQVNEAELVPNYNIGPTQKVGVINSEEPEHLQFLSWGLQITVNHHPTLLLNARADTLLERKTFAPLLEAGQTCFMLVDSYYEWSTTSKANRHPYRILLKDNDLFGIAGLYKRIVDEQTGEETIQFTSITTEPNPMLSKIHDRMPAILPIGHEMDWLKPQANPKDYLTMLQPLNEKLLQMYTVSNEVGKLTNNYPDLIKPYEYPAQPEQLSMF